MKKPRICVVITGKAPDFIEKNAEFADLFELRIDLIGKGWEEITGRINRPWIACCRTRKEGGHWSGSEAKRIEVLEAAAELGAAMVDIELSTPGLEKAVTAIKKSSLCLISYHDLTGTPPAADLESIVKRQISAGAYTSKIVTTARSMEDNLRVLGLISKFPGREIVAFCMGEKGMISRVICPLAGGSFTYASPAEGKESAEGQMTARHMREIYNMAAGL